MKLHVRVPGGRSLILFAVVMMLAGAVMTIAVAWGCRYMAQLDRSRVDADLGWLQSGSTRLPSPRKLIRHGADGRVFIAVDERSPFRLFFRPSIRDGRLAWNDFGVRWFAVTEPAFLDSWWYLPSWSRFRGADDPVNWAPADELVLPSWSLITEQPLRDGGAVIEAASGWPWCALMVRHTLPANGIDPTNALARVTTGAVYGSPFGVQNIHQVPYGVIGLGFLADSVFWTAMLTVIILAPMWLLGTMRAWYRRRRGCCSQCGFDSRHTTSVCCSECGWVQGARRQHRWGPPTIAGVGVIVLVGAAEIIYVVEVLQQPEVTPYMQAAFDGDCSAVQSILDDPDLWPANWADLRVSRGPHFRGLQAAILGDQDEIIDLLLDHNGAGIPRGEVAIKAEWLSRLRSVLRDLEVAKRFCDRHGLFDTRRWEDRHSCAREMARMFSATGESFRDLLERMQADPAVCDAMWWPMMTRALNASNPVAVRELLPLCPSDLSPSTVSSLGKELAVLVKGQEQRFSLKNASADVLLNLDERIQIVRDSIRVIRAEDAKNPGAWHTVVTARAIQIALLIEDPAAHSALLQLYVESGITSDPSSIEKGECWHLWRHQHGTPEQQREDWEALVELGIDVNLGGRPGRLGRPGRPGPPLLLWAGSDHHAFIRFLLEHGAIVTDRILEAASEQNLATIEAWLEKTGQGVRVHAEIFPPRGQSK